MFAEAESRVLGWSPPANEEFVDVLLTSRADKLLPLQNPTFHILEPNPMRRLRRTTTGIFRAASPASSTSEHSSDEAPVDKRADSNSKHADPAWVARPRNEFIIFRCEYVRKHSREGKRVRRAPGAEAEKTLSKHAAEAWHHLSPEERLYWKERANAERNEHARRYPDYRYRPKKSVTGRRRPTRCLPNKPAAVNTENSPIVEQDILETKPSSQAALSITRQSSSSSKGTPRRYASVPELSITEPIHRRLRSTASHGWIGTASSSTDHGSFSTPSREFTPMPQLVDNVPFESSDYLSAEYASPPAIHPAVTPLQSTSSLLNWNGARMVCTPPQATQFLSSTSVSISGLPSLDMTSTHMLSEYTTGGNPEPISDSQMFGLSGSAMHYTIQGDVWMSQLELQYPSPSDPDASRVAPADGVAPEPIDTQPMHESSAPASRTPDTMYGSGGGALAHQAMIDYGLSLGDSIPVDFLRGGTGSNAENFLAMETDDFFNHNF